MIGNMAASCSTDSLENRLVDFFNFVGALALAISLFLLCNSCCHELTSPTLVGIHRPCLSAFCFASPLKPLESTLCGRASVLKSLAASSDRYKNPLLRLLLGEVHCFLCRHKGRLLVNLGKCISHFESVF